MRNEVPEHQMFAGLSCPSFGSRHRGGSTLFVAPVAGSQSQASALLGTFGPPAMGFGLTGYAYQSTFPVGRSAALIAITGIRNGGDQRPPTSGAVLAASAAWDSSCARRCASSGSENTVPDDFRGAA